MLGPPAVDTSGVITLRHRSRLHHIGLGRKHAGTRVLVLVADLDVRVPHRRWRAAAGPHVGSEPRLPGHEPVLNVERCPETRVHDVPRHVPRHPETSHGAPNWTVLEKMSAGRRACAVSRRASRQASTLGLSDFRTSIGHDPFASSPPTIPPTLHLEDDGAPPEAERDPPRIYLLAESLT